MIKTKILRIKIIFKTLNLVIFNRLIFKNLIRRKNQNKKKMTGATLTIMIKKSKYKLISNKIHKIMFKLKMINKMDN